MLADLSALQSVDTMVSMMAEMLGHHSAARKGELSVDPLVMRLVGLKDDNLVEPMAPHLALMMERKLAVLKVASKVMQRVHMKDVKMADSTERNLVVTKDKPKADRTVDQMV